MPQVGVCQVRWARRTARGDGCISPFSEGMDQQVPGSRMLFKKIPHSRSPAPAARVPVPACHLSGDAPARSGRPAGPALGAAGAPHPRGAAGHAGAAAGLNSHLAAAASVSAR